MAAVRRPIIVRHYTEEGFPSFLPSLLSPLSILCLLGIAPLHFGLRVHIEAAAKRAADHTLLDESETAVHGLISALPLVLYVLCSEGPSMRACTHASRIL